MAGYRVTQTFKIREIMPLPEKEELGITVAQLISSSAFYWSTKQNKHLG